MGQDSAQSFRMATGAHRRCTHLAPGTSCLLTTPPRPGYPTTALTGSHLAISQSSVLLLPPTRAE